LADSDEARASVVALKEVASSRPYVTSDARCRRSVARIPLRSRRAVIRATFDSRAGIAAAQLERDSPRPLALVPMIAGRPRRGARSSRAVALPRARRIACRTTEVS